MSQATILPWLRISCAMNVVLPPGAAHKSRIVSPGCGRAGTRRAACWGLGRKTSRRENSPANSTADVISTRRPGFSPASRAGRIVFHIFLAPAGEQIAGLTRQWHRRLACEFYRVRQFFCGVTHRRDACATKFQVVDAREGFRRSLFHKALVFNEDILTYRQGCALINAWALAKVVLIGQRLSLGDRFRGKPLVYAIIFQAAIFAIILLIFQIIEETLIGMWRGKTFVESIPAIGDGTLQAIIITIIIMFFALIPFFAFTELGQAIGHDILHQLLFGRKTEVGEPATNSINSVIGALKPEPAPTSNEGQRSITIWYYIKAGKAIGPVTDEELRTLLKNKEIDESAFVWNGSFGDEWKSISETYLIYAVGHLHQFPDIEDEP